MRLCTLAPLQYEEGSAPALALEATIAKTEARFAKYGKQGLLCGTDGLPHLIADPGLALRYGHAGDIFVSCCVPCSGPLGWRWLQHGPTCWVVRRGGAGRGASLLGWWAPRRPHVLVGGGVVTRRHLFTSFNSPTPLLLQLPTLGFVYFAGWLGYSGSKYLQTTNSRDKEIIIDGGWGGWMGGRGGALGDSSSRGGGGVVLEGPGQGPSLPGRLVPGCLYFL